MLGAFADKRDRGFPYSLDVDGLAGQFGVVGGQLALFHDATMTTWEFGEEESGSGRRVGPASVFAYGSVTKAFTAALALRLVADGDLTLDRPVRSWLPAHGRAGDHPAMSATLRQLLSHTAGLPSDHDAEALSLPDWLAGFLAAHPGPDTAWWPDRGAFSYSNTGYAIAGRVIEAVTDLSWPEAMRFCLLDPLGSDVGMLPGVTRGGPPALLAHGHVVRTAADGTRTFSPVPCSSDPGCGPAGGLAGSAVDLARLGLMCLDDGPRPAELAAIRRMTRLEPGVQPFGLADSWGLGLAGYEGWAGHDGAIDGTTCHLRVHPGQGTVVALVTNSATGQAFWDAVVGALAAAGIPVGVHRPVLPPAASVRSFAECAGTYRNGDLAVTVEVDDSGLGLRLPNGVREPVEPHEGMIFSARPGNTTVFLGRFLGNEGSSPARALQYSGRTLVRENTTVSSPSTARRVST